MKALAVVISLAVLTSSQATAGKGMSSKWQLVSRSFWTPMATLFSTALASGATAHLVNSEAGLGVAVLGLVYFAYTAAVIEGRKLEASDIGRQVLYRDTDDLAKATVDKLYSRGHEFETTDGDMLLSEDVVAYEIFDHDDIGKQVLLSAELVNDTEGSYLEGHVGKVFTDGFYEILTEGATVSDNAALIVHRGKKDSSFTFVE